MIYQVISVSGGKDSTATLLLAMQHYPLDQIKPIFCDTGNEHEAVYQYLDYLESKLGIRIERLKADFSEQIARKRMFIARDMRTGRKKGRRIRWTNKAKRRALAALHPTGNPFLDLCMLKGRFPSRKAQFCTEELKRNIAVEFQMNLVDQGHHVVSWQGIRRDESDARKNAKIYERLNPAMIAYRPIVEWTAIQVFDYCASLGIEPNPLYLQGMGRVGCMPCINVSKSELKEIAKRFPDHIARISEWEKLVAQSSKRGLATFLAAPGMENHEAAKQDIWQRVRWAKTSRGGRQFDLLTDLEPTSGCSSSYGLCDQSIKEAA